MILRSGRWSEVFGRVASKGRDMPAAYVLLLRHGFDSTISFYCTLFVFADD